MTLAGELSKGKVPTCKLDRDVNSTVSRNGNLIMDTRQYEVKFLDREVKNYTDNTIAGNIYSNVDSEGHKSLYLAEILEHRLDTSNVSKDDGYITSSGRKIPRRTTLGWKIICKWKDNSISWVPLKDIKEYHPARVAEYNIVKKVVEKLVFHWWGNT